VYQEHRVCRQPEDDQIAIWQYMSLEQFISILVEKALFFVRACELKDDPYEGAFPKNYHDPAIRAIMDYLQNIVHHTNIIGVNCWYMGPYQSAAMWKLYAQGNAGIAIQSTFKRLADSFRGVHEDIYLGRVEYIDYEVDTVRSDQDNVLTYLLHKRKSFEYEQELRALVFLPADSSAHEDYIKHVYNRLTTSGVPISDEERQQDAERLRHYAESIRSIEKGKYVPVDLDTLIERIYLAPTSEEWQVKLMRSVVSKYELHKEVVRSDLNAGPVY
jgi:hypothetical protein